MVEYFCPESHAEWRYFSPQHNVANGNGNSTKTTKTLKPTRKTRNSAAQQQQHDSSSSSFSLFGHLQHYHNPNFCIASGLTTVYYYPRVMSGGGALGQQHRKLDTVGGENCVVHEQPECKPIVVDGEGGEGWDGTLPPRGRFGSSSWGRGGGTGASFGDDNNNKFWNSVVSNRRQHGGGQRRRRGLAPNASCRRSLRMTEDDPDDDPNDASISPLQASVLLARTPAAHGMKHVLPSTTTMTSTSVANHHRSSGKQPNSRRLDTYDEPRSQQDLLQGEAWTELQNVFGVSRKRVGAMRAQWDAHLTDIVRDNLLGQCKPGFSCKRSTKRALGKLLDDSLEAPRQLES